MNKKMSQPKQEEEPKEKIDPNRIIELNKKIAELKKKIQLAGRFCLLDDTKVLDIYITSLKWNGFTQI